VEAVGGSLKSPEGSEVSALWFGKWLAETNLGEFSACPLRAGVTLTTRMSLEATADMMWCEALVTKTKQRKIMKHLFDWFDQPIAVKEKDVDALAGKAYVKYNVGMAVGRRLSLH
jgi:hypothetical protein